MSLPCRDGRHDQCQATPLACDCPHHQERRFEPRQRNKTIPVVKLEWEDVPPRAPRRDETSEQVRKFLPELKRNPGQTARILTYRTRTGAATAMTRLRKLIPDLEYTTRKLEDGTSAVWAWYPGESE